MTEITNDIDAVGESVESLQKDLEAHLNDILGIEVEVTEPAIRNYPSGTELYSKIEFSALEAELEERLGADEAYSYDLNLALVVQNGGE